MWSYGCCLIYLFFFDNAQVWVAVMFSVPFCGCLTYLFTRYSAQYTDYEKKKGFGSIVYSIFYAYGSFTNQGEFLGK